MGQERMEGGRGGGAGVVKKQSATTGGGGRPGGGGGSASGGGKRWFYIALAILLVAGIASLSYVAARPKQSVSTIDSTIAPVPNQGHVMGSDSATVEVVEFADFECPACGSFATLAEPDVRARLVNTGLIRYRFMDFPLSMHRNTWPAHLAAWCAAEQGKFWEMHDLLFMNQDRWNGEATNRPDRVISNLTKPLGLDMGQFDNCVSTRKYQPQIQANVNEGIRLKVPSTPTFIIGNKRIAAAVPYDEFKRQVDEALAQARPNAATKATTTKGAPTKAANTKAR